VDRYLQFQHRSRENRISGLGSFPFKGLAFQLPSPLPRVSIVRRHRSFLCHPCLARFLRPSTNLRHGCPSGASHALKLAACPSAVCEPTGLFLLLTPSPRRAVRLPASSWRVHAWLHWPKLPAAHHTNRDRRHMLAKHLLRFSDQGHSHYFAFAPQANSRFNADANTGHRFAILMASVGARRPSASGAG